MCCTDEDIPKTYHVPVYVPLSNTSLTPSPLSFHCMKALIDTGAVGHDFISASALVRLQNLSPNQDNLRPRSLKVPIVTTTPLQSNDSYNLL